MNTKNTMKKHILLLATILLFSCNSETKEVKTNSSSSLEDGTYTADTKNSKVSYVGKKPTGEHTGDIFFSKGEFTIADNIIKSGSFELDMNSITCTDMEGEDSLDFVAHLKDSDFFSVDTFKTTTIQILSTTLDSLGLKVKANLTMKGITNPVEFTTAIKSSNDSIITTANFSIDRTLWGVKYRSKKIYQLADKFINDDVDIQLQIKAKKN